MFAVESQANDIIKLVLAFLTTGYTIYFLRDIILEMQAQMTYEKSFMDLHPDIVQQQQENVDVTIPLTFVRQETEHLRKLCRNYRSIWFPTHSINLLLGNKWREPSIETQYLRIRRLGRVPRPIKIDVVRCSTKYALIEAGDGFTGYILKLDKANLNSNLEIFNIDAKFLYKQEPLQQGTPLVNLSPSSSQHRMLGQTDEEMQDNKSSI